jgi:hypothetical protein
MGYALTFEIDVMEGLVADLMPDSGLWPNSKYIIVVLSYFPSI